MSLIIKQNRPRRRFVILVGIILVLTFTGIWLYQSGVRSAGYIQDIVNKEKAFWQQKEYSYEAELQKLREKNAILQRGQQVEHEANKALEKRLAELHDEMVELKSELTFYRGIVAPSENIKGLNIQQFTIYRNSINNSYDFRLVLTQVLKVRSLVSGGVLISVTGMIDGKEEAASGKDLGLDPDKRPMLFRFKYFQTIDGQFLLPENFVPVKVKVTLLPKGQRNKKASKEFDWVIEE